jgi:threonine synthase
MVSLFSSVHCLACGHHHAADIRLAQCDACGSSWLDAHYDYARLTSEWWQQTARRTTDLWRYQEMLPVVGDAELAMGEGWTPLTRARRLSGELELPQLWLKDERQQPTGSFKDRQAAITVAALKQRGIDEMVLASTGNAAAAYAAYCARADIKLWVFLTSSVPAEKMRELALYGAEVVKITGTYDQAKRIAANFAERRGIYFDIGARGIVGKESMKTIAYEIVEQMGGRTPDWYVQAVSGGIGPLGVYKGFAELYNAGLIDRIPKFGIIQVEGCAPMVQAWQTGAAEATPVQPDTLITVLATGDPGFAYPLLSRALQKSGGTMLSVGDGEAFRAMRRVARTEGFSVEPAAAVAFAGLEKLIQQQHIALNESVVVNCSGHTFSAEKHALEDRYILHLETAQAETMTPNPAKTAPLYHEGLSAALKQLDEQVTTIVIIDDNPHDSRLIRRLLQSHKNYRVFEATNGPDGIDLVRQRQPELVVLDLTLPDMDGFSILDALKRDPRTRQIPVMIVSAKSLTQDEERYLRQQTDSIWQKGNFQARDLLEHVLETLEGEQHKPMVPPVSTPRVADKDLSVALPWNTPSARTVKPRILIVDDNMLDARLLRRLFEARQRFEVVEAYSAQHALASIKERLPDLIILDLVLPDTRGETFLQHLRAQAETHAIPVIVVSAKMLDAALRSQLAEQADSIWEKGVMDRNSLLAHIETMLTE